MIVFNQDGAPRSAKTGQGWYGAHCEWNPQDWKQVVELGFLFTFNYLFYTIMCYNTQNKHPVSIVFPNIIY